ncbi:hypothetical protein NDU88_003679 [Pleurodeles waltl]|uniref:Uncharacterized protein n=1 Tax=Pleurodeles waltl TaxID=8319 RepID=A0AAV7SGM2_PLEWA|nr:hypothetical protein NDU88_003679 [Pleurodeles waltl]
MKRRCLSRSRERERVMMPVQGASLARDQLSEAPPDSRPTPRALHPLLLGAAAAARRLLPLYHSAVLIDSRAAERCDDI